VQKVVQKKLDKVFYLCFTFQKKKGGDKK
jgi:hypothetical protein